MGVVADVGEGIVIAVHFAALGVLVVGGYLALRHRWVLPLHLGMVAWGVLSVVFTWDCPLTDLQQELRALGGRAPLPGGFIDTYVSGVIVPADADGTAQLVVLGVVGVSWVLLIRQALRSRHATPVTSGPPARG